jgi:hypothetical protein
MTAPHTNPTAQDLLLAAADVIDARGKVRDNAHGERSMETCVRAFNALTGSRITVTQGWQFMLCLKMSRAASGGWNHDDWIDLVGYAALAAESAHEEYIPSPTRITEPTLHWDLGQPPSIPS